VQSQATQDGIRYITGFVPALFILVGVAIMVFYPLTEDRFRTMVAEVAARRAAREE
jgi:glucuronide carrier protein